MNRAVTIELNLIEIYDNIGIESPTNHADILTFIENELSGIENVGISNVIKTFKKFLESPRIVDDAPQDLNLTGVYSLDGPRC